MKYGAPRDKTQKYRDSGESHTSASKRNLRQIIEHDCSVVTIGEMVNAFLGGGGMTAPSRSMLLDHTKTHNNHLDSSGRVISPLHRPPTVQHTKRQTSMVPAGFQPTTPATERPETHALNGAATEIGLINKYINIIVILTFLRAVAQSGNFPELAQNFWFISFPYLPT